MLPDLSHKNIDIEAIAKMALADEQVLAHLIANLTEKQETIRFNSFNSLMLIAEKQPEVLYPKWNTFAKLLGSKNSYHQYIGIFLIAELVKIDAEGKFEPIFDQFYGILESGGTIAAANLVKNSGKIALAKPALEPQITEKLLNIDAIHNGKQKGLIKGIAVEAFGEYYGKSACKDKIRNFVIERLESDSPKAKHNAAEFLNAYGGNT